MTHAPLDYQPKRGGSLLSGLRLVIFVIGLVLLAAGLIWSVCPLMPREVKIGKVVVFGLLGVPGIAGSSSAKYLASLAVYMGLFLLTQWLLLAPRGTWRIRLGDEARPLWRSALAGGFVAMLLSIGLLASLQELRGRWQSFDERGYGAGWLLAMGGVWLGWAVVFALYYRSLDRRLMVSRMLRLLIGGTILELLVAAPVYALAKADDRLSSECYCARGSYTGLVLGLTAAIWLFGPGLLLLFLREKKRRQHLVP
jgi:hypothetical protein